MRDRGGEPDPDRGRHHLPEADQRGGRAGLLAERGERLRGAERIDDAHAEQEHAHGAEERQEGGAVQRDQQHRDAAGGGREQSAADRAVEPVARRQLGREHAGGEHDQHGAGEEQAELDRREVHRLDQDARRGREHREQPAHDQADGCGRHHEAAVGDQAEIVFGDRERIERRARRMMGLAEHAAIGDGAERGKGRDQHEFGTPAEIVIERAAEQRREAGRRRHRDHDQRHRARQRGAGKHVAGDRAGQHRGGAGAGRLDDAAGQQARQVGGEARTRCCRQRTRQSRSAPASGGRNGPRSARPRAGRPRTPRGRSVMAEVTAALDDVQRRRHLRQRRQQDVGGERAGRGKAGQHGDLQGGGGGLRRGLASIAAVWSVMAGSRFILNDVYHIKRDEESANGRRSGNLRGRARAHRVIASDSEAIHRARGEKEWIASLRSQ